MTEKPVSGHGYSDRDNVIVSLAWDPATTIQMGFKIVAAAIYQG